VKVSDTLRLDFRAPHLSFPPPGPFCLACGDRPAYPRRVQFPDLEFFAPLCGRHLRRAQVFKGLSFLLAIVAVGVACMSIWFPSICSRLFPRRQHSGAGVKEEEESFRAGWRRLTQGRWFFTIPGR